MMVTAPENIRSIPGTGSPFALAWTTPEDVEIHRWHFCRCDYPITPQNARGLIGGAMDLMVTRWELHPTWLAVVDDTGVEGKHYTVIGEDPEGQLHFPDDFAADPLSEGKQLSREKAQQGWIKKTKGKGKDRYSKVF